MSETERLPRYLTFDDVGLVPLYNIVRSRTDTNLNTTITTQTESSIPWIPSNMDTVIGPELACVLLSNGGVPIFHRFTDIRTRQEWVEGFPNAFHSCGVSSEELDRTYALIRAGCKKFCIDIAHGHSESVAVAIDAIKDHVNKPDIIAGNVCTPEGYRFLAELGATAVKVGVGPGAACTTRVVTGFGVPQFSAIRNIAAIRNSDGVPNVPIIADGGIRTTRDACLALAAGANSVMMGKLFAATTEASSRKILSSSGVIECCEYRGQASAEFQREFYGTRVGIAPEGVKFNIRWTGTAQDLIENFSAALRSSLTYCGVKTIPEFQHNARFFECTHSYIAESHPRPN
jgi:IMP dehydrogenase